MMDLFWLEHKKLWRRMSTKVSVILCLTYSVIFGSFLNYQWFTFEATISIRLLLAMILTDMRILWTVRCMQKHMREN